MMGLFALLGVESILFSQGKKGKTNNNLMGEKDFSFFRGSGKEFNNNGWK